MSQPVKTQHRRWNKKAKRFPHIWGHIYGQRRFRLVRILTIQKKSQRHVHLNLSPRLFAPMTNSGCNMIITYDPTIRVRMGMTLISRKCTKWKLTVETKSMCGGGSAGGGRRTENFDQTLDLGLHFFAQTYMFDYLGY